MNSIELFGGCGGLGIGLARAGFRSLEFWERDDSAVRTVLRNRQAGIEHVAEWHIVHDDVRKARWSRHRASLALISGGPPCQAFAIGGNKRGHEDPRDMWPEAIRAVHEARPAAFLFENVRNLAGPAFRGYLGWIEQSLRHSAKPRRANEAHDAHRERLESLAGAEYRTSVCLVCAADFGAPQNRRRVFVAGLRADLLADPGNPRPTHSRDRLLWDQWVTGDYWRRHAIARPPEREIAIRYRPIVARLRSLSSAPAGKPWVTLRDAIADLGPPTGRNNHAFQPGARTYKGHTGSPLDWPAKALKAGDHGVPGGENMMLLADGSVRYFTLRESARLVGLPDTYVFPESWTESMRQLGNAVPAQLAEAVGRWLMDRLAARRHDLVAPSRPRRVA